MYTVVLAKLGVPDNEYNPEARAIISRLKDITDMKSLRWVVYEVFKDFLIKIES